MGEVDELRDAKNQRKADRGESDDRSELETDDEQLSEAIGGALIDGGPRPELEDHHSGQAGADDDFGQHRFGRVREADALGKGVGVERDLVGSRAGHLDAPRPIFGSHGPADLSPVEPDDHGHAADGLADVAFSVREGCR